MGYLKYIRNLWKKPKESLGDIWKERLMEFRREPATIRVLKPTRIDRARSLGYRAKQGIIVVRQRVTRGGFLDNKITGGRRPKHNSPHKVVNKSHQRIAEERVAKDYTNCEVLNSYYVAEDGKHLWYEVILIDKTHPQIVKDEQLSAVAKQTGRVFRGLTSVGKRSRGLRNKGKGSEKVRPTQKAHGNRLH
ncbi:MAG: 50S ribosomal protein L15e [Candidatus Woesearchaeota archaeon]